MRNPVVIIGSSFSFLLFAIPSVLKALPLHIIPEPVKVIEREGVFHFAPSTRLILLTEDHEVARICSGFARELKAASGIALPISVEASEARSDRALNAGPDQGNSLIISLQKDPAIKNEEGYSIDVGKRQVHISACGPAGLFYAFESIRQLLPPDFYRVRNGRPPDRASDSQWILPCSYILDYPRYAYRGMHLDVSRHFFSVAFIEKYLDILAWYKINIFHWHLTDSHGWRLEIKQYPRLTTVGAWRADRKSIPMTIAEPTAPGEPALYGGFYTQAEVREVVAFAKERFITIIPEIEMPGHCTAALVAYPQYADLANEVPLLMPCGYPGDLEHNFCVGYDSTFVFLENILTEVMELFPGSFIHIGGDEVRSGPWLHCPRCRQRMLDHGFTTANQLQGWFTHRIDSFITASGRKMIGWDEILRADLSPGSGVMYWHAGADLVDSARKNNVLVLAPYHYTYFDFYQSDPGLEPDITYAPLFLDTVYAFDPGRGLSAKEDSLVIGGEACLWTENIAKSERVEYMLLPRLLALSEDVWSPGSRKDYRRFIAKVEDQFRRFNMAGIHYASSMYNVSIQPAFDRVTKTMQVVLSDQTHQYPLRYTIDGKDPSSASSLYVRPLHFTRSVQLKTAAFDPDKNPKAGRRKDRLANQGKRLGSVNGDRFTMHKAVGCSVQASSISSAPDPAETSSLDRLVDGIYGTAEPYDGRWVSFHDPVIRFTIDLGRIRHIHSVSIRFLEDQVANICLPVSMQISSSADGTHFDQVLSIRNGKQPQSLLRHVVRYRTIAMVEKEKYIRVVINKGNRFSDPLKDLVFLDEVVVE